MKLKLFLIAASAMALASCSSDSVIQENAEANEIQFSVVANNGSRAADYYCNNAKPGEFSVWAKINQGTAESPNWVQYFADETYRLDGGVWKLDGTKRYWPDNSIFVHFYAVWNDQDKFKWDNSGTLLEKPQVVGFEPAEAAADQEDFIYAYKKANRPASGNSVSMNFRHALSQIVFQAQNLNKNIYVKIEEVKVGNVAKTGTFTFPAIDDETTGNLNEPHDQTGTRKESGIGSWAWDSPTDLAVYTTGNFGEKGVKQNGTIVNLTNNTSESKVDAEGKIGYDKSLLLIPTTETTAWNTAKAISAADNYGTYFAVRCKIWNLQKGDGGEALGTDVVLWDNVKAGTSEAQYIYIPVKLAWEQGKKYIYTIKFTENGHGGYTEEGKDVLIPIEFTVTVDDFAVGSTKEIDVDQKS